MAREGAPAGRVRSWRRHVLGPTPSARAMAGRGAIEQALAHVPAYGIAAAAIRESHHIGCLTAYLERAAAKAA
jgi:LDH2 family malate/lactate/ureidoglycolate dehydrogenase